MKTWYAIDLKVAAVAAEAVESAFNQLDSLGTEMDTLGKSKGEPVLVTGFFETLPLSEDVERVMSESLRIYGLPTESLISVESRVIEETDWLSEWKKHWKPTKVGKFVIAPPWSHVEESDKIVIRIEPNMAFGTGTHETTKLCLAALSKLDLSGRSFMDVGTGTGILAMAVAKLGGDGILALDTDEDSVKIARENAELNNVDHKIDLHHASLEFASHPYDIVCANLTLDVIEPMLEELLRSAKQTLILSGILVTQQHSILDALSRSGAPEPVVAVDGEWISVTVNFP